MGFWDINLRAISWLVPKLLFCIRSLKITILKIILLISLPSPRGQSVKFEHYKIKNPQDLCLELSPNCHADCQIPKQFEHFNSLAPGRFEWHFRRVIFKLILVIDGWIISCEIAVRWMSLDLTDDKSTLVQVMAWGHQAPSHYLSQCWHRSMSPYGVTRPQWVNTPPYRFEIFKKKDPVSIQRPSFQVWRFPIIKIRQLWDCLIFMMGIHIPGKTVLTFKRAPVPTTYQPHKDQNADRHDAHVGAFWVEPAHVRPGGRSEL